MGFWQRWFDQPSSKKIAKQITKAKERYAQPDYRRMAMDKLLSWNTEESLEGVLQRFTVVVQSPHWDEEEKTWLLEELAKKGDLAKKVLSKFLLTGNQVTHAAMALSQLCEDPKEYAALLVQALQARSPEDYRSSQAKMELIAKLDEAEVTDLPKVLMPYLDDHNDDVQCMVLDVIASHKFIDAYPKVAKILSEEFRSARVLRHAANYVYQLGIGLDPASKIAPEVVEDYIVKDGHLVPKASA